MTTTGRASLVGGLALCAALAAPGSAQKRTENPPSVTAANNASEKAARQLAERAFVGRGGNFGGVQGAFGRAGIGCGGFLGQPEMTATTSTGGPGGPGQACCCSSGNANPDGVGGGNLGGGGGGGGSAGTTGCSGHSKGAGGSSAAPGLSAPAITDAVWLGSGSVEICLNRDNTSFPSQTMKEVEPNGDTVSAMAIPLGANGSARVFGNVYPNADVDLYSFIGIAGDRIYAAVMTSASASTSTDSQLRLLGSDGSTEIEFDEEDGTLGGLSSSIAGAVIPSSGTYYLQVKHSSATNTLRGYDLYVQTRAGIPTPETEPNDTPAAANTGINWAAGTRNPAVAPEQDWYAMTLAAGDTVFLSLDLDPERDNVQWNGRLGIALFGDAANQVVSVDDASAGSAANPLSEAAFVTVKDAGTYYAFVDSANAATGGPAATYHLNISVFPRVPIGVNATTHTSTNVPQTIGPGAGLVSSTITVPGNPRIASLRVTLDLNHALMADLDVNLRSPAGSTIALFNDIGATAVGGQTQMVTTFADDAAVPPAFAVLKGLILRPELNYRLDWLNGVDAGGVWTLDIHDDVTNASGGTINGWSLEISEEPAMPVGATVFSADFESGAAGFTHSGTADEWELGTPASAATTTTNPVAAITTANSGTMAWKTDLDNTYNSSSNQDLFSPDIILPAGRTTLSWAQRYQFETATFDHAYVEVQEVGGAAATRRVWEWLGATMIIGVGSPVINVGQSAGWGFVLTDISDFAGKTIRVRFHLDSDSSINLAGWALDDVSVTAVVAPTVTAPTSTLIAAASAVLGGNVTFDGGSAITERGVVFSVTAANSDPMIGGPGVTKVQNFGTTGVFTVPVSGLSPATGYSFKAYATNSVGVGYSGVGTFSTLLGVSVSDVSLTEGNSGATNAVFTVTLSGMSAQTITVSATTGNLSAAAGSDYTATGPIMITFAPGVGSQTFSVPITGDLALESDETFQAVLSAPTNASIAAGVGIATIINDDGLPPARVFVSEAGSDVNVCAVQTTPCRNLTAAISQVALEGEVIVLSPGEYDTAPILIGKSVKITSPTGTVAFVRQPITVNARGGRVVLRGLTLKGSGSENAITLLDADALSVEETGFDGWARGIDLANVSAAGVTVVSSSFVANSNGIRDVSGAAANRIAIVDSRFERNGTGLNIFRGAFIVRETLFAANQFEGVAVGPGSADIRQAQFWDASGSAVKTFGGGTVRIGRSHIFGNGIGLSSSPGGLLISGGTNIVRGNAIDIEGAVSTVPEQ